MARIAQALILLIVATALTATGWWAGRVALDPPNDPLGDPVATTYTVVEGTVGRSLTFAAVAEWPVADLARSGAAGVVTSIAVEPGGTVNAGDVLLAVNLRPITVGLGSTPMFRDLSMRDEGPDIAQLQVLLKELGFFEGDITRVFDTSTRSSVRMWQKATGVAVDGVVRVGDVIFFPEIPVQVVLADEVSVGASLAGGEVSVRRVVGDPLFVVPLVLEQRNLVPLEAMVSVSHGSGVWVGRIGEVREEESQGQLLLLLVADGGGAICGDDCAAVVPLAGRTDYSVEIVVVPETTGPVIPIAAIMTSPDGSTSVLSSDGRTVPVAILEASNGIAVVEGVSVGDVIVLPVTRGGSE